MERRQLLIGLVGGLTGCAKVQQFIVDKAFQQPTVAFKSVELLSFSLVQAEVAFVFEIDNPNPITLNIASLDFRFVVNGIEMAKGTENRDILINKSGTSEVKLQYAILFGKLMGSLLNLSLPDAIDYELDATARVRTWFGEVPLPMQQKGSFKLSDLK